VVGPDLMACAQEIVSGRVSFLESVKNVDGACRRTRRARSSLFDPIPTRLSRTVVFLGAPLSLESMLTGPFD
jgi:hypothetical protein